VSETLQDRAWCQQEPPDYEDPSEEECRICGAQNDDGEGWDGLCGNCSDRAEFSDNHDRRYDAMYSDRTEVADNDMVE